MGVGGGFEGRGCQEAAHVELPSLKLHIESTPQSGGRTDSLPLPSLQHHLKSLSQVPLLRPIQADHIPTFRSGLGIGILGSPGLGF